jgi:hypothetical protein
VGVAVAELDRQGGVGDGDGEGASGVGAAEADPLAADRDRAVVVDEALHPDRLEVPAGKKVTGSLTLSIPGSYVVEAHHQEKTIVILNAR